MPDKNSSVITLAISMNDVERGHITALAQMNSTRRIRTILQLAVALIFAALIWAVMMPNYISCHFRQAIIPR